jgi:tetratricopeptide (TPR) repeat protein
MNNLCPVYRYEVLLNLGLMAEKPEHGQDVLQRAIKLNPDRREAYGLLASVQMDAGQHEAAIATCEKLLSIPEPKMHEWTHRPDMYGWKAFAMMAWAHRLAGNAQKAEEIEQSMLEQGGRPRISLLHATRGRWAQAITMMNTWLGYASNAFHVEHIFAIDEDDEESRKRLSRFRHVISPADGYSVGAWNAAAQRATGDVLIQMSDDFMAPPNWDQRVLDVLGGKLFAPAVVRVSDGLRNDGLITMAIVTRRWLEKEGTLFDPEFRNVYSDNDLTARALRANAIVEAPHLVFEHRHPLAGKAASDATYERGNNIEEYNRAAKIYANKHPQLV